MRTDYFVLRSSYMPWLLMLALLLAAPLCMGTTWLGAQRLELVHITLFDSCAIRAYQLHWQDRKHYPKTVRYDFTNSPVSFGLVEIWIENGPTLRASRIIPLQCPAARRGKGLGIMK